MSKYTLAVFLTMALTGCEDNALRKEKSDNPKLDVSVLGDVDGCRIYRFEGDNYFVRCQGSPTIANYRQPRGKASVHRTTPTDSQ